MATTISSPSSASPHDDIPTATLALPAASASASRRLPPPCWTPDETSALIDAYKDKWYSLRRGNLRANHWQDVADDVGSRCPADPPKTAVQCRHKMEKLRKRYRAEMQRTAAHGGGRRFSSWAHFQNMHSMDKGPEIPSPPSSSSNEEEDDDNNQSNSIKRINDLYNHNNNRSGGLRSQHPAANGSAPGVRIKIPGGVNVNPPTAKVYSKFSEMGGQKPNPRFTNSAASGYGAASNRGEIGKRAFDISGKTKANAGFSDLVAAIEALGEGFMKTEKVKMDMAREMEEMRMEMEFKRTEMILESQQRILESFAEAISEKSSKKAKRTPGTAHC